MKKVKWDDNLNTFTTTTSNSSTSIRDTSNRVVHCSGPENSFNNRRNANQEFRNPTIYCGDNRRRNSEEYCSAGDSFTSLGSVNNSRNGSQRFYSANANCEDKRSELPFNALFAWFPSPVELYRSCLDTVAQAARSSWRTAKKLFNGDNHTKTENSTQHEYSEGNNSTTSNSSTRDGDTANVHRSGPENSYNNCGDGNQDLSHAMINSSRITNSFNNLRSIVGAFCCAYFCCLNNNRTEDEETCPLLK